MDGGKGIYSSQLLQLQCLKTKAIEDKRADLNWKQKKMKFIKRKQANQETKELAP